MNRLLLQDEQTAAVLDAIETAAVLDAMGIPVEKHDIKNALYHSSNFGIIYDLIGAQRKRMFISENSDIEMNKQEEWNKIMVFFRHELRNRE